MASVIVTEDGRIELPADLISWLRAKPGDTVEVTTRDGEIVVKRPRLPPGALYGLLRDVVGRASLEDMEAAVVEAAAERVVPRKDAAE
jgi:AbrB family looped-hinge helix DNA binding protein